MFSFKNKYYKYYYKNIEGGSQIVSENAVKYLSAYRTFIQNKIPLDLNKEFGPLTMKFIMDNIVEGYMKIEENSLYDCNIEKTQFLQLAIDLLNFNSKLLDINQENNDETTNFYLGLAMRLHRYILYNCIKYKYYSPKEHHHIDRTDDKNRYTQNNDENLILDNTFNELSLGEIYEMIEDSSTSANIKQNITNIYGKYDIYLFSDQFVSDTLKNSIECIRYHQFNKCFSETIFDLSHLYTFHFPKLDFNDLRIKTIYDNVKYLHLPLAMYTYDSDILYKMNTKLRDLYNPLSSDFFENEYINLSFIMIYCLINLKKYLLSKSDCLPVINTTISYSPYKSSSSFAYRGILINKDDLDMTRLEYQVKINSFSKNPDGAKNVLEFYYDKFKLINPNQYDTIVLYIAKHDNNFIPIQFFNPQIKVSHDEEEIVTLPFVKYECELILEYDYLTENKKITDEGKKLDLDISSIHHNFFRYIEGKQFHCSFYFIKNITDLVDFDV